jgi:hypothetical protein
VVLSAEEPVSPELALVDSDLAQRARAVLLVPTDTIDLIDSRRFVAAGPRVTPPPVSPVATAPVSLVEDEAAAALSRLTELDPDSYDRLSPRRGPTRRTAIAFACAAAAAATTFGVTVLGHESSGTIAVHAASTVSGPLGGGAAQDSSTSAETEGDARRGATAGVARSGSEQRSTPAEAAVPTSRRRTTKDVRDLSTSDVRAKLRDITWSARRFIWPARRSASGYHVELRRGDSAIFVANPQTNRLVVPKTWRYKGRKLTLDPDDRLSVWPVAHGLRAPTAIISGELVVDLP